MPKLDEVRRFFVDKKVSDTCELCGHREWNMVNEPLHLHGGEAGYGYTHRGLSLLAVGCGNCGQLRIFPLSVIQRWLEEHP